ncbi:hypothetical protein DB346_16740 [Verrucomicrobia bacterium LW23]|nr:hypothetical protein DB346_16740 [Verrucomicrobia bacterium LW23]
MLPLPRRLLVLLPLVLLAALAPATPAVRADAPPQPPERRKPQPSPKPAPEPTPAPAPAPSSTNSPAPPTAAAMLHRVTEVVPPGQTPVHSLEATLGLVTYAVLSPDGKRVVVVNQGAARLLDATDGRDLGPLTEHKVLDVSFSPDGTRAVVSTYDRESWLVAVDAAPFRALARVVAAPEVNPTTPVGGYSARPNPVAFSADSKRLFAEGTTEAWQEWDAATGAKGSATAEIPADIPLAPRTEQMLPLVDGNTISPDGRRSVQLGGGMLSIHDLATSAQIAANIPCAGDVSFSCFSHDSALLAVPAPRGKVTVLAMATGKVLSTLTLATTKGASSPIPPHIFFTRNNKQIVTVNRGGLALEMWPAPDPADTTAAPPATPRPAPMFPGSGAVITAADANADGGVAAIVVARGKATEIQLWNTSTRARSGDPIPAAAPRESFGEIALSPDGTRLLAQCLTPNAPTRWRLYDIANRKEIPLPVEWKAPTPGKLQDELLKGNT